MIGWAGGGAEGPHLLDHEFLDFLATNVVRVLRGNDYCGDFDRLVTFVANGNLRLTIRTQPLSLTTCMADLRDFATDTMSEHYCRWHELFGFIRRVAEHDSLVARALLGCVLILGLFRINALSDVR